jgi:hypothetical protein
VRPPCPARFFSKLESLQFQLIFFDIAGIQFLEGHQHPSTRVPCLVWRPAALEANSGRVPWNAGWLIRMIISPVSFYTISG